MNHLALRISNKGSRKKRTGAMAALGSFFLPESLVAENDNFNEFVKAETADQQLTILTNILQEDSGNSTTVSFLVKVFFHAEAKHCVKCFLARHITKNSDLQQPFTEILSKEIQKAIAVAHTSYQDYIMVVSKLAACIENFEPGTAALKMKELDVLLYLDNCMNCCIETLKSTEPVAPTEKNEIFNLAHLALRLLVHLIQKISADNLNDTKSAFQSLKQSIKELLFNEDVPMDTKSVCGILFLTIHLLEKGENAWTDMLQRDGIDEHMKELLSIDASRLSIYSAIITSIAIDKLHAYMVDDKTALTLLIIGIKEIGTRRSSDSMFVLAVTRTMVQISKLKDQKYVFSELYDFVLEHSEHNFESVRHLTEQMLSNLVKYSCQLNKEGENTFLHALILRAKIVTFMKSSYITLTALVNELGAVKLLQELDCTPYQFVHLLYKQAVQASVATWLDALLQKHMQEVSSESIYDMWFRPFLREIIGETTDSVTNILENLLAKALKADEGLIPFIVKLIETPQAFKMVLTLLSVGQKAGRLHMLTRGTDAGADSCRGFVPHHTLQRAAIHSSHQIRIRSLSLIVESPKTTEMFTLEELDCVLYYLKYNINAQSPNFRQLTLSMMKKFVARLEDSYKVLKRQQQQCDYYLRFLDDLSQLCFDSLFPGANYSRRFVALQVLAWCQQISLDGYQSVWKEDYVEKLLLHLEDSYETNKVLALDILQKCPTDLLTCKKYATSLELSDVLQQALCMKPTECVTAKYKLRLLATRLPAALLAQLAPHASHAPTTPEPVAFALLQILHGRLLQELEQFTLCTPVYGLLHCARHVVSQLDVDAISGNAEWSALVSAMIEASMRASGAVESVVCSAAPEGLLPADASAPDLCANAHCASDGSAERGAGEGAGRAPTAQMVLLCAWRCVQEVSLLLGEMASRLTIGGEGAPEGTLSAEQMLLMGEYFTTLLHHTKHRGAFEQAYVGFTKLLTRIWGCRSSGLHELPRQWLRALLASIQAPEASLSTSRRGAGLPFLVQALVTTEVQVQCQPHCFHESMTTLLRLARSGEAAARDSETTIETRTHSLNILRALFRNSALHASVAPYVGPGLEVALEAFEGRSWMERNAATLLFSALVVRVFGVQRARDELSARNCMTGRIFFHRYPALYQYMLSKLSSLSAQPAEGTVRPAKGTLQPALFPVLLLLARLYPSELEGTVEHFKLSEFVPHVVSCAGSCVLKTRQLAARAIVPLIPPSRQIEHMAAMLNIIVDNNVKSNYCHGILLQLTTMVGGRFETDAGEEVVTSLGTAAARAARLLAHSHVVADQLLRFYAALLLNFPSLARQCEVVHPITQALADVLFPKRTTKINFGREICTAHAFYLYFIILKIHDDDEIEWGDDFIPRIFTSSQRICKSLVQRALAHPFYEVVLAALNYILITNDAIEPETEFEKLLKRIDANTKYLRYDSKLITILCDISTRNKYLECTQKALKALAVVRADEKEIARAMNKDLTEATGEAIANTLIDCLETAHENVAHILLENLLNFSMRLTWMTLGLKVLRTMLACSAPHNSDAVRTVVASFLEQFAESLLQVKLDKLDEETAFEYKAVLYATLVTLLEDDNEEIRQKICKAISRCGGGGALSYEERREGVVAARAGELLAELMAQEQQRVGLLAVIALLDFKSEVCMTDEITDEGRVFDQNERHNIYLEEAAWSCACAARLVRLEGAGDAAEGEGVATVQAAVRQYPAVFRYLCNHNLDLFENMLSNECDTSDKTVNPKIRLFIDKLRK